MTPRQIHLAILAKHNVEPNVAEAMLNMEFLLGATSKAVEVEIAAFKSGEKSTTVNAADSETNHREAV